MGYGILWEVNGLRVNHKKRWICLVSVTLALVLLVGATAIYLGDYYHADAQAIEAFCEDFDVDRVTADDGTLFFVPKDIRAGFIFYPGGKVEHTAYEPLMQSLAAEGILCVLPQMPFRLAVLDIGAADGILEQYPEVRNWYIGGHSLGGSMAATYLSDHTDDFCGLVLLGAYSTADLSECDLSVLSIYGSEDGVMNLQKYEEMKKNLPKDFEEVVLEGACHAYFGTYGAQKGDGTPTASNEQQIEWTVKEIVSMMRET